MCTSVISQMWHTVTNFLIRRARIDRTCSNCLCPRPCAWIRQMCTSSSWLSMGLCWLQPSRWAWCNDCSSHSEPRKRSRTLLGIVFQDVVAPMVEILYTVVLEQVGLNSSLMVSSEEVSGERMLVAADIEETLQMFSQLISRTLCEMPCRRQIVGSVLLSWAIGSWRRVCHLFSTQDSLRHGSRKCVQFAHRRYLYGQSVLATCIREQAWNGVDVARNDHSGKLTHDVVRVLRGVTWIRAIRNIGRKWMPIWNKRFKLQWT